MSVKEGKKDFDKREMQKFCAIKRLSAAKSEKRSNASPSRVLRPIASAFQKKKNRVEINLDL